MIQVAYRVVLDETAQLADVDLLYRLGDASDYWKAACTPPATHGGPPILSTTGIITIQQGVALAASERHALLACKPLAEHHARTDLRSIPVRGLEATSQLGLVCRTDRAIPQLAALAQLLKNGDAA